MGKKKSAHLLKEKMRPYGTSNCSTTARNLRTGDLHGVIFGCTHKTIKECYTQLLFGLPYSHGSYTSKIGPGLTLFLFNYSDRKLHGVFEAAGHGTMNINPHAWTDADSSELTQFPAQVRVNIRMQCQPLAEDQFKPIIAQNYNSPKLFRFELDHSQTTQLIKMFLVSPITGCSPSKIVTNRNVEFQNFPPREKRPALEAQNFQYIELGQSSRNDDGWGDEFSSSSPRIEDNSSHLPQKMWSSLFKTSSENDTSNSNEEDVDKAPVDYSEAYVEQEVSRVAYQLEEENSPRWGDCTDEDDWEKCVEENVISEPICEVLDSHISTVAGVLNNEESNEEWGPSVVSCLDGDDLVSETSEEKRDEVEVQNEYLDNLKQHFDRECSVETKEMNLEKNEVKAENLFSLEACILKVKSSGIESIAVELIQGFEELKASQMNQSLKIHSLEQELVKSKEEVESLKHRCKILETRSCLSNSYSEGSELSLLHQSFSNSSVSIFIAGGYDGASWLSASDIFSPSIDKIQALNPMSIPRAFSAAAMLNGEVYIIGGVDGSNDLWHNTVELYNPSTDTWTSCPSLNQRRGNLAGSTIKDKIFAVGGGNGNDCFSDVEMFDPDIGRWIPICSMLHKRFAPAAAEINGRLYVAGGYNGNEYLKSMDALDPREHSWTSVESMNTRRGCHSLVNLNDKLYAIGGHDGTTMVPSMEVLDPRFGSWMTAETLNVSRGYSGAVVIGQSIYLIGGLDANGGVLDTVESYTEGHGWELTNFKAVGKRCHFSAIIL